VVPFLHLTMFGLGWNRPDLGIERWMTMGKSVDDPIPSVVNRWWAQKDGFISDFLTWSKTSHYYGSLVESVAAGLHSSATPPQPGSRPSYVPRWFGENDSMHVQHHVTKALQEVGRARTDGRDQELHVGREIAAGGAVAGFRTSAGRVTWPTETAQERIIPKLATGLVTCQG
jgi:hypothetical protein